MTFVNSFGKPDLSLHEDSRGKINPTPSNEYMQMLVT